jgi:exodeoxyribonuclease V alpha subunit
MDRLTGTVERVTYYNPDNGYSVVRLHPDQRHIPGMNREGFVTLVGNLPELSAGEHVRVDGRWTQHPKHGQQFQVETCEQILPATVEGIRRYLGSGLIKGVGPRLAERIVEVFGAETLDVIDGSPERLQEVPDIGMKRMRLITTAWEEQKQVKEIMVFLHGYGISTNLAVKVFKQYGTEALQIVQNDPYRLAQDISGVGFKTADKLARLLGLPVDHPSRIEAGVVYALNELSNDGHVFALRPSLVAQAAELLNLTPEIIASAIDRLEKEGLVCLDVLPSLPAQETSKEAQRVVSETSRPYGSQAVYLAPFYHSEVGVAERLSTLNYTLPSRLSDMPPSFLPLDMSLSPEQQAAVRSALSHPVSVLTGGPGTGKTTAVRALITALELGRKKFALASPTGRAAKRLAEATGRPASTIHRLLGFSPGEGFKFNFNNPLPIDLLVVDEASMLDLILMNTLLKALKPGTHLLLVGDVDQLPSVGAGDVLRDIIKSGLVPVTRLGQIFRQAAGSQIITNAHRINQGEMPLFAQDGQDFFLFPAEEPEDAAQWVQDVVSVRIPARFGLDAKGQIQVLSPMYRGPAGVTSLNERLQAVLNPPGARKTEKILFGQTFRAGDKLMQIQNNYDKDVFNGDMGALESLDLVEHVLRVNFDGRLVDYDWSEADQLMLAYAVSVHKAQGSEFPAVVIPLVTSHYLMLQRNLLYTAITRAKQLCVLVGSRRAISIAVHNDKVTQRNTALDWRLSRA